MRATANPDAHSGSGPGRRVRSPSAGRVASRINGASVEIYCDADQKMQELRRVAAMGDTVVDIEMTPPRLEDLYRYYAREGQT